jgi:tetratricopeptide (TPR) repeat protein
VLGHLEQKDQSAVAGGAVLLASHAERGEVWDKAADYLVKALAQSVRSWAFQEAIALYDRTLRVLEHLPAKTSAPFAVRARLLVYNPLISFGSVGRALETSHEAEELARGLGDKRQLALVMVGRASLLWWAGTHETELVEEALQLANELDDLSLRVTALQAYGDLLRLKGELREASDCYTQVIESLSGELEMRRLGWSGIPSVMARSNLTWTLVSIGEFERAGHVISRAMEQVRVVRDPYSLVHAYCGQGLYQSAIGEPQAAMGSFEAAYRVTQRADFFSSFSAVFLAVAYAQGGRPADALALLLEAERNGAYGPANIHRWFLHYMALAQAHVAMGALPLAYAAVSRAEEIAEGAQAPAYQAAALQIHGSVAAKDPAMKADGICAIYQRAIDIARPCGMRPLIAQCMAGMALACKAAGDISVASDYDNQARQLFDELGLPPDSPMRRQK